MAESPYEIPTFLTHYYFEHPFRSITMLDREARDRTLAEIARVRGLKRRLQSQFYFDERSKFELTMRDQFLAKGGEPELERPHYLILGENKLWATIAPNVLRISLESIPSKWLSFTYTDSWSAYVCADLNGQNPTPRKPQYGQVYRVHELPSLFETYGWPGERYETEKDWEHDIYVEAQLWSEEPLCEFLK